MDTGRGRDAPGRCKLSGNVALGGRKLQPLNLKWHLRAGNARPTLKRLSASTASRSVPMINLRQGRWLQAFTDACNAKRSLTAVALTGALLMPGAAWGGSLSRAHRPLPTTMHVSHVSESTARSGTRAHKGSLKSHTGAAAETSGKRGIGTRQSSGKRGGKGRSRRPEPVGDAVPMFRADRAVPGAYTPLRGRALAARGGRRSGLGNQPAPLVSAWRHGHGAAMSPAGSQGRSREAFAAYAAPPSPHGAGSHTHAGLAPERPLRAPADRYAPLPSGYAAPVRTPTAPSPAYAMGVAHPDDDAELPRSRSLSSGPVAGSGMASAGSVPTGSVSAAPVGAGSVLPHTPAVVQGFGSEVAVPPAGAPSGADRPGGTRRRNHPSSWTPEPTSLNTEPLDEREAITEAAVLPAVLPELYDRSGHLVMRAPLKGSHDVLVHQNVMADNDGLERMQNDADLQQARAAHLLVGLPQDETLHVNEDLPALRRMARPWTVMFAVDIAHAFYQHFHEPIYVTSAVRTVQYQARLQMVNGNAAGLWGDSASPHLTGQAIDMAKRGMSNAQLAWMRGYLQPLMQAGKIDVEEEFHQACFHVSVYRSYAAGRRAVQHEVAQVHPSNVPVNPVADDRADGPE